MAKTKSNAAKNIIVLFVVALISVAILAVLNQVTMEPIAKAEEAARQESYMKVYSDADEISDLEGFDAASFVPEDKEANVKINAVLEAKKGGEKIGYVIDASSPNGYGGDVQIALGITNEGEITDFTVISAASETPGLGAKSTEEDFQKQFSGLSALVPVDFSKTGADRSKNEYDAISGATITSTAVKQAVNEAIAYYNNNLKGE
ncbi:MAG: RnfABCDGE type electron transport complex subunit G [Eubacterium sp.]|nr:RnfABCDGE type electron transport complex subunit G [Eubacterium sp.]